MIFQKSERGFTLIEMMISAGLMALILGSGYMCLSAAVSSKKLVEARAEGTQSARVALAMMAADFRMAVPMTGNFEFLGMRRTLEEMDADNVDFCTRNYRPKKANEPDYCEISYFLMKDPDSDSFILTRRRDPTPDPEPLEGGNREEIARGVRGLRIEYYDGIEWWDDWGDPEGKTKGMQYPPLNSYGMPEAVRVTLVFDPEAVKKAREGANAEEEKEEKAPMTFSTVARVDLTPFFSRQTRSQSSGTESQSAPEQGQNAAQEEVVQ